MANEKKILRQVEKFWQKHPNATAREYKAFLEKIGALETK